MKRSAWRRLSIILTFSIGRRRPDWRFLGWRWPDWAFLLVDVNHPDVFLVPMCQTVLYRVVRSYTVTDFTDQIKNLSFLFLVKVCWFFILHTHALTRKSSLMVTLYHSSEQDSNLGSSSIAVFEDCKATALTTQPPRLDALWRFLYIKIFCQKPGCNFKSVLTGASGRCYFPILLDFLVWNKRTNRSLWADQIRFPRITYISMT